MKGNQFDWLKKFLSGEIGNKDGLFFWELSKEEQCLYNRMYKQIKYRYEQFNKIEKQNREAERISLQKIYSKICYT
jgi:hypothetical protein